MISSASLLNIAALFVAFCPLLTISSSNKIHSIKYNQRNGLDYYLANHKLSPKVSSNLKSYLPSKLAAANTEQASLHQLVDAARQSSTGKRQAKQLEGFQSESAGVCLTPGCVKAAAEILKNVDERVDPCDDFYRYSCGNWIESQVIPEDKTSVSLFSVVQDELDNKLRNLIEQSPNGRESPIVEKMRNLYESCMNTSK